MAPKIYTRKGDDGSTGLLYGGRVDKDSSGPDAYGDRSGLFLLQASSSGSDRLGNAGGDGVEHQQEKKNVEYNSPHRTFRLKRFSHLTPVRPV